LTTWHEAFSTSQHWSRSFTHHSHSVVSKVQKINPFFPLILSIFHLLFPILAVLVCCTSSELGKPSNHSSRTAPLECGKPILHSLPTTDKSIPAMPLKDSHWLYVVFVF
jgi:hypothetical protein